ncbi:MAG: hypothetical protein LAO09_20735, partial [Acidobacteriia bacterium]|nr:hypothetical protein [Terriglobia bacterium]
MQTLRLILTVALLSALSAGASDNGVAGLSSLPVAAQANISAALGRDSSEYYARPVSGGFEASSPGLAARFTSSGVEVSSGSAHWGLALRGYGYGNALWGVNAVAPQATKNRVEYRHGTMIEWYMNGPMGLEQGFTISQQPGKANGQPLTIALETSGDLAATAGDSGTRGMSMRPACARSSTADFPCEHPHASEGTARSGRRHRSRPPLER